MIIYHFFGRDRGYDIISSKKGYVQCLKNSKHWSNEKGSSSTTKIVQRNNFERSNATSQCIWIQIFSLLLFYPFIIKQIFQYLNKIPGFQPKVNIFLKNSIFKKETNPMFGVQLNNCQLSILSIKKHLADPALF
jgi:hypothetical protein